MVDELRIPLRTHSVNDAPSGIGIDIGVDIGSRFSMYDSDSDAQMCAHQKSYCRYVCREDEIDLK